MTKDRYFLMTVVMVAIVAVLTIYSYYQKTVEEEYYISLEKQVLEEQGNRNVPNERGALKNLDISLLRGLGDELNAALKQFAEDLIDMEEFSGSNADLSEVGE